MSEMPDVFRVNTESLTSIEQTVYAARLCELSGVPGRADVGRKPSKAHTFMCNSGLGHHVNDLLPWWNLLLVSFLM